MCAIGNSLLSDISVPIVQYLMKVKSYIGLVLWVLREWLFILKSFSAFHCILSMEKIWLRFKTCSQTHKTNSVCTVVLHWMVCKLRHGKSPSWIWTINVYMCLVTQKKRQQYSKLPLKYLGVSYFCSWILEKVRNHHVWITVSYIINYGIRYFELY